MSTEFDFIQTLGEGAFGKVYLVSSKKGGGEGEILMLKPQDPACDLYDMILAMEDGKISTMKTAYQYAMKVIDLRTSPQEEKDLAVKEAQLLKQLDHPHVLNYTDSFEKDGALCIVTGYCANGDLSQYIEKRKRKKLDEDQLIEWFRQITSALQYLHGKKIIHRDVKTPNIFLTDEWQTKLGDLGLAKVLERPNAKAVTFCGSPYYMSPEIFSCKPYDEKSDIWALGVIVYEMATLERPFDAMLMHQLVFKIVHGGLPPMPTGYNPKLSQVLSEMMQKDPSDRPSADNLLNNDLFKEAKKPPKMAPKPAPRKKEIIQDKQARGGDGPFDMNKLLDTLSLLHKKEEASGGSDFEGDLTLTGIMAESYAPRMDKTVKKVTLKTLKKSPAKPISDGTIPAVSTSDVTFLVHSTAVKEDLTATMIAFQKKVADESFNVMQLVVRTMTGLFPKDGMESQSAFTRTTDPAGMMLRQIEHLQYYCIKALGNDTGLFQKAYDLLGMEKDEGKLEDKLIEILGLEKYKLCGVQLLFLKNFEYNLEKLHGR